VLDRVLRHKMSDLHGLPLPQAMDAANALLQNGGVPGLIDVDNRGGVLQIQADAASVRRQEYAAVRLLFEARDQVFPFRSGHSAVEQNELEVAFAQPGSSSSCEAPTG